LIQAGASTLVAAPTGSGKTLTAFLAALNALFVEGIAANGALPDETRVLYVSPLKALSNDVRINLDTPLAGISAVLAASDMPVPPVRTAVRTGDTPQTERTAMRKRPPHVLVTTPESLYVLLGSDSGRKQLSHVRTVIVDEIHAVAGGKRGSHLALSLERLEALCGRPLVRVGLSATQKPIDAVARFLVGRADRHCAVIDIGHTRGRDLGLEIPPVPLESVMSNEVWEKVYDRLAALAQDHRTTLVFVNTRRMAERAARHLSERLGSDAVAAHHGSLAREQRLDAEQRLKRGELRLLIATASLELGIDIGDVELVCQLGSPGSISAFLQRVGRSGHQVVGTPKGRLFPNSRDDLIECAALLDCVRRGELDTLEMPVAPLDVLAQQIIAEVSCQEWDEDALLGLVRCAAPYATLDESRYQALLAMLAQGYTGRQGVRAAYLHRDAVSGTLRGRRGGKLTAVSSGGTIPDNADYSVLLEPQGHGIGTVNEDFAVESLAGDIFQLGNTSYRILKIEPGRVRVEDAKGQPPNIPFWHGEAPGRSHELSQGVARLRGEIEDRLASAGRDEPLEPAVKWLTGEVGIPEAGALQIVEYLARARAALGGLPTLDTLVMERFFDASGGMQLVIHSPFGSRVNRAWGLALRKRFCRTFNFELQAAATEDAIVFSLSTSHSFPLDEVWRYLNSNTAEQVLIQALLDAPLFGVRWRWNATTALALPRMAGGRKVAPQLQRMRSEDLLATVFPDQVACLENIVGEREVPKHPLVEQALDDCLHEAMDARRWLCLLQRIERGGVRLLTRDLPSPSPLAMETLSARPYAFLDDAPLEERRTQAVLSRGWTDPTSTDDLGALDIEAIEAVSTEAWPRVRSVDEMHEALMALACLNDREIAAGPEWIAFVQALAQQGRATRLTVAEGEGLWVALEALSPFNVLYPHAPMSPSVSVPNRFARQLDEPAALVEVVRARLSGFGPVTLAAIAQALALPESAVSAALTRLEGEGYVMRGRFSPDATDEQWCERQLLARIHRYTVRRLRREIEPVERADYMRFLLQWQHLAPDSTMRGPMALSEVIEQLEGFQAAAGAWEDEILPSRIRDYGMNWLDEQCRSGRTVWLRLSARSQVRSGPVRGTPIVLLPRRSLSHWSHHVFDPSPPEISPRAARIHHELLQRGASFFDELQDALRLLPTELENALGELVALGLVNADSFAGLRALLAPAARRPSRSSRRGRGRPMYGGMADAGRWALLRRADDPSPRGALATSESLEHIARALLRRYGVICWNLLDREADWMPPWRDLLRVYHRLEARGEIRGGRFINGLSGEQFALPEAIAPLRAIRRSERTDTLVSIAAVDPANLTGILLPGDRVPAIAGNRVLLCDGVPVAAKVAGEVQFLNDAGPEDKARWRAALIGGRSLE
jgi:ATP-dependent Lhr-like helicase